MRSRAATWANPGHRAASLQRFKVDPDGAVAYRNSPNMADRHRSHMAKPGEVVVGVVSDHDCDWVQVEKNKLWLPRQFLISIDDGSSTTAQSGQPFSRPTAANKAAALFPKTAGALSFPKQAAAGMKAQINTGPAAETSGASGNTSKISSLAAVAKSAAESATSFPNSTAALHSVKAAAVSTVSGDRGGPTTCSVSVAADNDQATEPVASAGDSPVCTASVEAVVPEAHGPLLSSDGASDSDSSSDSSSAPAADDDASESAPLRPMLKYVRCEAIEDRLRRASKSGKSGATEYATDLSVTEKFMALGTFSGCVHILDLDGNDVRSFSPHAMPVNALSLDPAGEYVCSCSDEGLVVISPLFTADTETFTYGEPIKTAALCPDYSRRGVRDFMVGSSDGQVRLKTKGWFGKVEQKTLNTELGAVHVMAWHPDGRFVAWASATCVTVVEMETKQVISQLGRPPNVTVEAGQQCSLTWTANSKMQGAEDGVLLVGWGPRIQVMLIRRRTGDQTAAGLPPFFLWELNAFNLSDGLVCAGIASYDERLLAVLCLPTRVVGQSDASELPETEGGVSPAEYVNISRAQARAGFEMDSEPTVAIPKDTRLRALESRPNTTGTNRIRFEAGWVSEIGSDGRRILQPLPRSEATSGFWPQLRLCTLSGDPMRIDLLPLASFRDLGVVPRPSEFRLRHVDGFSGSEALFYIMGPHEVVMAKPSDEGDRIEYLLQSGAVTEALELAEQNRRRLRWSDWLAVVDAHLTALVQPGPKQDFAEAAREANRLLRCRPGDSLPRLAWEKWAWVFVAAGQLPHLLEFLPIERGPGRLSPEIYEMALAVVVRDGIAAPDADSLLPPGILRKLIQTWPAELYSAKAVTMVVLKELRHELGSRRKLPPPVSPRNSSGNARKLELMEVLVLLLRRTGDFRQALDMQVALATHADSSTDRLMQVFELVEQHGLWGALLGRLWPLLEVDAVRTVKYLTRHTPERLVLAEVVSILKQIPAMKLALIDYLKDMNKKDATLTVDYHDFLLEKMVENSPGDVLPFLKRSVSFNVENALELCKAKGGSLNKAVVHLLSRLGKHKESLDIIFDQMGNFDYAVEFVRDRNDPDLWEELLDRILAGPPEEAGIRLGLILQSAGPYVNPLAVLERVPTGLEIPGLQVLLRNHNAPQCLHPVLQHPSTDSWFRVSHFLQHKLVKIISDYRFANRLRSSCADIVQADAHAKQLGFVRCARRAVVHSANESVADLANQPTDIDDVLVSGNDRLREYMSACGQALQRKEPEITAQRGRIGGRLAERKEQIRRQVELEVMSERREARKARIAAKRMSDSEFERFLAPTNLTYDFAPLRNSAAENRRIALCAGVHGELESSGIIGNLREAFAASGDYEGFWAQAAAAVGNDSSSRSRMGVVGDDGPLPDQMKLATAALSGVDMTDSAAFFGLSPKSAVARGVVTPRSTIAACFSAGLNDLVKDSTVLIQGLSKAEHNGKAARIIGYVEARGRYTVELPGGKRLSLKSANLCPEPGHQRAVVQASAALEQMSPQRMAVPSQPPASPQLRTGDLSQPAVMRPDEEDEMQASSEVHNQRSLEASPHELVSSGGAGSNSTADARGGKPHSAASPPSDLVAVSATGPTDDGNFRQTLSSVLNLSGLGDGSTTENLLNMSTEQQMSTPSPATDRLNALLGRDTSTGTEAAATAILEGTRSLEEILAGTGSDGVRGGGAVGSGDDSTVAQTKPAVSLDDILAGTPETDVEETITDMNDVLALIDGV